MNGRWWETADRQVVAVNALEIVPVGQCSVVWVHRHRVEVPQVGDIVGGLKLNMPPPLSAVGCNGASGNDAVDGQSCRRPTDFGGGVARVVDLVDFWDRRGGSAVSSDVVGAGAVVTFLLLPRRWRSRVGDDRGLVFVAGSEALRVMLL
eukprot:g45231.t1